MGWNHTPNVPPNPELTQFQPGDSSMVKMLKVTRWALLRGGTFKPTELQKRFGTSKSMAYSYTNAWRQVFGTQPPPRARREIPAEPPSPKINLSDLLGE